VNPHPALEEAEEAGLCRRCEATIAHGMLVLPGVTGDGRTANSELLDISGRNVLDLLPGPNDVRHLALGVYFVRQEPQASSHKQRAVSKIVITR